MTVLTRQRSHGTMKLHILRSTGTDPHERGRNDAGLGPHFDIPRHRSDIPAGGMPVHAVPRRVLEEATTVAEAHDIIASAKVSASTALTVATYRDGRAAAASPEMSPAGVAVVRPGGDGWVVHTNHFLDAGPADGDTGTPESASAERYAHARAVRGGMVERAAALAAHGSTPYLRVTGIKVMVDGTVDGCTAALGKPYANGAEAAPIWSLAELAPVVAAADAAGLRVALHAIGDEAVRVAIGAVEHAVALNGPKGRRHRIEHLEVVDAADIDRLAALGITAGMQPVHADPAIQDDWRRTLGDERADRGFPWPEMTGAGAVLVLGTDSPTSPHAPLPNMFVAATRRSALDPSLPANLAHYALPLADAIVHATRDAAWASRSDHLHGRLAEGQYADFVVLDRDVFARPLDELLDTRVLRTVVGGRTVHHARPEADR
ncbi:C45 family autoproteolytic acyltransferase/hydolase [Streptomyces sp. NPDC017868]|uniref:C45 family autoproteolytic acyltransferase/hydolase n=1 Tax=Streptomyces sp. NPDC017868 TaxID=3365014 RepID=UPI0037BA2B3D